MNNCFGADRQLLEHQKSWVSWYDYGARMYDPALGRFTTKDPLAEWYYAYSNYIYALDNPVMYKDILGLGADKNDDKEKEKNQNNSSSSVDDFIKWAEENGIEVTVTTEVPQEVVEAFEGLVFGDGDETTYSSLSQINKDIETVGGWYIERVLLEAFFGFPEALAEGAVEVYEHPLTTPFLVGIGMVTGTGELILIAEGITTLKTLDTWTGVAKGDKSVAEGLSQTVGLVVGHYEPISGELINITITPALSKKE